MTIQLQLVARTSIETREEFLGNSALPVPYAKQVSQVFGAFARFPDTTSTGPYTFVTSGTLERWALILKGPHAIGFS